MLGKDSSNRFIAELDGPIQWEGTIFGHGIDVGTLADQDIHDIRVPLTGGTMQGRFPKLIPTIHLRALFDQKSDDIFGRS